MPRLLGLLFGECTDPSKLRVKFKELLIPGDNAFNSQYLESDHSVSDLSGLFLKSIKYDTEDFVRAKRIYND